MIIKYLTLSEEMDEDEAPLAIFLDNAPLDAFGNERSHEWNRFFLYLDRPVTQDEVEYLLYQHYIIDW